MDLTRSIFNKYIGLSISLLSTCVSPQGKLQGFGDIV